MVIGVIGSVIGWFVRTAIKLLIRGFTKDPTKAGQRAGLLIGSEIARATDSGQIDTAGPGGGGRFIGASPIIRLEEILEFPTGRKKLRNFQRSRRDKQLSYSH